MLSDQFRQTWKIVKSMWSTDSSPEGLDAALAELRTKVPAPVFWLFGKTQTGKTSIIHYLTGAEDAAIGNGFRPCTRTSREYPFPTADAPLLTFLDTRGVDEPGYDPTEDLEKFDPIAHVMVVTAKLTDLAQGNIRTGLTQIRKANRSRPIVLALTCLHEAYAQTQHPEAYPYTITPGVVPRSATMPSEVQRLIDEHAKQFDGLFDLIVPIDLTKPEEGYTNPTFGGPELKDALLTQLPSAYRQALVRADELTETLKDLHLKHAGPIIAAYASLAATAGAIPIPFLDLLILPAIQSRMVFHLAKIYGQELNAARFLELAGSLGMGLLARQAVREVMKLIPIFGSVVGATLAGASTFALGRAFCFYYEEVHAGHVPDPARLKAYYQDQFTAAEKRWKSRS